MPEINSDKTVNHISPNSLLAICSGFEAIGSDVCICNGDSLKKLKNM